MVIAGDTWIAILPTPGMGHLIPLVEFAKTLSRRFNVFSTFFIPTDGPISDAQSSFLSHLPPSIEYVLLPPLNFDDLSPNVKIETRISVTVVRSLAPLLAAVKAWHESKKFAAFVVDLFGTDGFHVSGELNIPQYIFFPSTAMLLSVILHLPKLDETVEGEYWAAPEKIRIPGCIPIHGRELVAPLQDRKDDSYKWMLHHSRRYGMADGIMVNTFDAMEGKTIKALQETENGFPPVYPIGPLIQIGSISKMDQESSKCLKWLDEQPPDSVLFVSFGSGGTLSHDQLVEVAMGLELSGHRFLWVVRCPNDRISNAEYFNIRNSSDPLAYLPEGFLQRTKNRGLVVPLWAPQALVLAHGSVGGFVSHCGWNSTLESVVNGVPLIAWPLYAEQRMNAVMLIEEVKVALRPEAGEDGVVDRVEMSSVVKKLMEGEEGKEIQIRVRVLEEEAAAATAEGGSATKLLAEVVNKWKKIGEETRTLGNICVSE